MSWQVHVYGAAGPGVAAWCFERQLPVHVFDWRADHGKAGPARDGLYLLRPDSYVALAAARGSAATLDAYCKAREIQPGGERSVAR